MANRDVKDTSLEVEVTLPDGRTVRGQIEHMNEGDRPREMLLVHCRDCGNEETKSLPDSVYVNVDAGQVIPIWKLKIPKEKKTADAPQQGARTPGEIKGNSTQQPWPVGNIVLLGLLILLIALVGLALGLILVLLLQLRWVNNISSPSIDSLPPTLLFWSTRALIGSGR